MAEQLCTGTTTTGKAVPRGAWGQPRAVGGTAASPVPRDFPEAADTGDIREHSSNLQTRQPLLHCRGWQENLGVGCLSPQASPFPTKG